MKNPIGLLFVTLFAVGAVTLLTAAQGKQARVTQVVQDVRLLTSRAGARPAVVNDTVTENTSVRTGGDSRAELMFQDQTLARIGANSVFSFADGARQFDLASGAMLLAVPKSSGTVRVNSAGATAAVSGFVALFESHKNSWSKWIILEGEACIKHRNKWRTENCITLGPGEMILLRADGRFTDKKTIDVDKVVKTAGLIRKFNKLPPWVGRELEKVIAGQIANPPQGGFSDLTGVDSTDQHNAAPPQPPPHHMVRPPASPPPSF